MMMPTKVALAILEGCICYIPRVNMCSVSAGISIILTIIASLSSAEQTVSLRCYVCVTDYEDSTQDPGCSIPSTNVIVRTCAVQHGYDRCISYRARSTKTGNAVFRRHCATREMCEYQCLFSHHTNCQKSCCHRNLCNDAIFGGYEGSTITPDLQSTTKVPVTTRNRKTTPPTTSKPTVTSKSTSIATITKKTTNAPVTTQQVVTTDEDVVGGPPITSRLQCQDDRDQCPTFAAAPGYCQYWKSFMLIYCPRSCNYCDGTETTKATTKIPTRPSTPTKSPTTTSVPVTSLNIRTTKRNGGGLIGGPTTGCRDKREECPDHADFDGYCQYHYGFMLTYCPLSCDLCDNVQVPESPTAGNLILTTKLKTSIQHQKPTTPFVPGKEDETDLKTTEQVIEETTPFGPGGEDYENSRCLDLKQNCSHYALTYDDYCNYNKVFMAQYCPFSCGFCGTTVPNQGAFPHPPVFDQYPHTNEEFPAPPGKKDARWVTSFCEECHNGYQECVPKCILLFKDGTYEPTRNDVCMKLLGKPNKIIPC